MTFGCGGPFGKAKLPAADAIREKYARDGDVSFDFVKEQLPEADKVFQQQLTHYIAANTPGVLDEEELEDIQEKWKDKYSPLVQSLKEHSPYLARFKHLSEKAAQWCLMSSCRKEKEKAELLLSVGRWDASNSLTEKEARLFVQQALPFLDQKRLVQDWGLGSSVSRAITLLPKKEQDSPRKQLRALTLPLLWNKNSDVRKTAREIFSSALLKPIIQEALKNRDQQAYAFEHLISISSSAERKELVKKYKAMTEGNTKDPFAFWAVGFALSSSFDLPDAERDKSLAYFEQAVRLEPNNAFYQSALGMEYKTLGRYKESLGAYSQAFSLEPNNREYEEGLAWAAYQQIDKVQEAKEHYEKLAKQEPQYYNMVGKCYFYLKKEEEAKEAFSKFIDSDPDGLNEVGTLYSLHGKNQEALGYYRRARDRDPYNSTSWRNLASIYQDSKAFGPAIEANEKIFQINGNKDRLKVIADLYNEMGNQDRVIETLERMTKHEEADAEDFYNLGDAYYEAQKYEEAAKACEEAVKREPNNSLYQNKLGNVYYEPKKYTEALPHYQRAVALDPKDAVVHSNLGNDLYQLKKYEEAISSYQEALRLNPKDAAYASSLATTYQKLKKYSLADQFFLKAIHLREKDDPDLGYDWFSWGDVKMALGYYADAIKAYEEAAELKPGYRFNSDLKIIEALRKSGRLDEAFKKAEGLVQGRPESEDLLYQYALVQFDRRELYAAQKALEKIVDTLNPNAEKELFDTLEKVYKARGLMPEAQVIHQRWIDKLLSRQAGK